MASVISIPNHNDLVGLKGHKENIKTSIDLVYETIQQPANLPYYLKSEVDSKFSQIGIQLTQIMALIDDLDSRLTAIGG